MEMKDISVALWNVFNDHMVEVSAYVSKILKLKYEHEKT